MTGHINTKDLITKAADTLFYQKGFEHTSFADIAQEVNISRGNLYHHFKTKDEMLCAVIQLRLNHLQEMLHLWEEEAQIPQECVKAFFSFFTKNRENIKAYGCPVGTLCNEMAKLNHSAGDQAVKMYALFRQWLQKQFRLMGYPASEADKLAIHALVRSQGIATLFNAFKEETVIEAELASAYAWLETITKNNSK